MTGSRLQIRLKVHALFGFSLINAWTAALFSYSAAFYPTSPLSRLDNGFLISAVAIFAALIFFALAAILLRKSSQPNHLSTLGNDVLAIYAILAIPALVLATFFVLPRQHARVPTDHEMRKNWKAHSEEIKSINQMLVNYWAKSKYESITLYSDDKSGFAFAWDESEEGEQVIHIATRRDEEVLRRLMKSSGIEEALIDSDGAWYESGKRGYFYYDSATWSKRLDTAPVSRDSQLDSIRTATNDGGITYTFVELADGWYIGTFIAHNWDMDGYLIEKAKAEIGVSLDKDRLDWLMDSFRQEQLERGTFVEAKGISDRSYGYCPDENSHVSGPCKFW